jgi:hypothetical protein
MAPRDNGAIRKSRACCISTVELYPRHPLAREIALARDDGGRGQTREKLAAKGEVHAIKEMIRARRRNDEGVRAWDVAEAGQRISPE